MIEQRDLLLVPFPFSDQTGKKVRPVIVISNDEFNKNSEDILVVGVTSNISRDKYTVDLAKGDFDRGELSVKCCVKVENILKIDKSIIIKNIGKIKKDKFDSIKKILLGIIS
jgi:mRNA interferase MazF